MTEVLPPVQVLSVSTTATRMLPASRSANTQRNLPATNQPPATSESSLRLQTEDESQRFLLKFGSSAFEKQHIQEIDGR
jgi:hypothetical protein